jgi:hypothetical protein
MPMQGVTCEHKKNSIADLLSDAYLPIRSEGKAVNMLSPII